MNADTPKGRGGRSWRRRLCLAVASGLFTLLLAEGALRAYLLLRGMTPTCYAASVLMFQPHLENGFELAPGFQLRSQVLELSVNSLGLRGREIPKEKPAGTYRVALLGGSAAFGYLVSDSGTAAELLERRLRQRDLDVEVLNAAVPSYDLRQLLVRYKERVEPLAPDIVVFYLGWNDLKQVLVEEEQPREPATTRATFERWLAQSSLYGLLRYRLIPPQGRFVPQGSQPIIPTEAGLRRLSARLEELARRAEETPARLVICAQAMAAHPSAAGEILQELSASPERQQELIAWGRILRDKLKQLAQERGAVFVDAYREIPPTYEYLGDAIHLTPDGEERLAELLEAAVLETLASDASLMRR